MLAPENTLMSFEKAVQSGCEGLETDVTLSLDGMPFLMHDRTLLRTTNVSEEFPESIRTPAAWFTWAQLQRLNAGAWFLKSDPFRSAGALSEEERVRAQNQTVCSLLHFLELAARSHSLVIFDLYRPPKDHPYRDTWIQRTLDVLNQSTMPSEQVLWLPSDLRSLVQETDPDLQQTSGSRLPLEELQSNNIVKLNLHYSAASPQLVREYSSVNVSVNLYVVSEPWLFSVAWCCGVQSVTTNAPQLLSHMTQPLLLMSPAQYRVMWTLTDLLSVALVLLVFFFHWWRERALTFSSGSKVTLDTGSYSKFPTELSEVWSVSSVSSQGPPPGAALPSS
uniref:Glycerophosphodiester phosphodiesterase domain containing 4b n=1 Tax=Neogobius melanostomus TaxID=47308 RepID=A0A8C6WMK9_9GOBI